LGVSNVPGLAIFGEHENKMTHLTLRKNMAHFSKAANDASTLYVVDRNTATLHFSLLFGHGCKWNNIFKKKVDQLISSGLVKELEDHQSRTSLKVNLEVTHSPQPLKMDHLGICFATIMISLGFSLIVFLIEYLTKFV
jgi:hypothetical protein